MTLPTLVSSISSEEPRTAAPRKSITPIRVNKSGNEQNDSAAAIVTLIPPQNLGSVPVAPDYVTHLQAITAALAQSNNIAWENVRELRKASDLKAKEIKERSLIVKV